MRGQHHPRHHRDEHGLQGRRQRGDRSIARTRVVSVHIYASYCLVLKKPTTSAAYVVKNGLVFWVLNQKRHLR